MIIEIHGAGFQNKGAELMLRTVISELKSRIPDFVPAIDPTYGTYEKRCELGLRQTFPLRTHVGTPGFSKRLFKQKMFGMLQIKKVLAYFGGVRLEDYGCVALSDIQALIDIAGFAYTDQWGSQPTKDFAELTEYYRSCQKPVILLPQAFGPFLRDETKSAFRKVIDNANLIFARDRLSYQYLMELSPNSDKVLQAPDLTLFYPDFFDNQVQVSSDYVCLVPNIRMLDLGKQEWGEKYESYLTHIGKEILDQGLQVRIIVHDSSGEDLHIAQSIFDKIDSHNVTIVNEQDPIAIKELIGGSFMVIGSRYHSLVASFSKNVPAIALGWSHKYEMLFEDFGCEYFLINHDTKIEIGLEIVRTLIDPDKNLFIRNNIKNRLEKMHLENKKMWDLTVQVLRES